MIFFCFRETLNNSPHSRVRRAVSGCEVKFANSSLNCAIFCLTFSFLFFRAQFGYQYYIAIGAPAGWHPINAATSTLCYVCFGKTRQYHTAIANKPYAGLSMHFGLLPRWLMPVSALRLNGSLPETRCGVMRLIDCSKSKYHWHESTGSAIERLQ